MKNKYSIKKLSNGFRNVFNGITGFISSDKKDYAYSINRIIQNSRTNGFLVTLFKEFDYYAKKGKINTEFVNSEEGVDCIQELLDFLEKEIPDKTRVEILKKILLSAACDKKPDSNKLLPVQYIKIVKKLDSAEVLILFTAYKITKEPSFDKTVRACSSEMWRGNISKESGLESVDLIKFKEKRLMEYNLLRGFHTTDDSGVSLGSKYRLTDLGYEICDFVNKYENLNEGLNDKL